MERIIKTNQIERYPVGVLRDSVKYLNNEIEERTKDYDLKSTLDWYSKTDEKIEKILHPRATSDVQRNKFLTFLLNEMDNKQLDELIKKYVKGEK